MMRLFLLIFPFSVSLACLAQVDDEDKDGLTSRLRKIILPFGTKRGVSGHFAEKQIDHCKGVSCSICTCCC